TVIGAMIGREIFATVGQPAVMRVADALRFRPALERAIHLLRRGGPPAVFAGRLIPGLRIHTTQAAGISNMPSLTFAAGLIPAVRRNLADSIEARLFRHRDDPSWREYPLIRRLWAALLDLALAFGITVLILTAVSGLETTEVVLDPQGLLLLAGVAVLYRVPSEARTGQTLGKLLMGISVSAPTGGVPVGW